MNYKKKYCFDFPAVNKSKINRTRVILFVPEL